MLLQNLFHEFPHSDPITYHQSAGEGFPAFLSEQDGPEDLPMFPPGNPSLSLVPSTATRSGSPVSFPGEDPPDDIPITYPPYDHTLDHNRFADSMNSTPNSNLADWFRGTRSSGRITGGVLSDGGSGKVNISQMDGMIFVADSLGSKLVFFRKAAVTGITPDDLATSWVYLDYDSGNLTYRTTTTRSNIHEYDQFTVGRVRRDGTTVEILQSGHNLYNKERRQHNRLILKYGTMDWVSGAQVSQTGTNHIALSLGNWYVANTPYTTAALDTNPPGVGLANYNLWSYINGAWVEGTTNVTVAVTQYNKMTPVGSESLANLSGGAYGVYWVFLCPSGDLGLIYGQDTYTSATAAISAVPVNLPGYFANWAQLIGRITFKQGTNPWTAIETAFGTKLTYAAVTDHNALSDLQGGSAGEYYHLSLRNAQKVQAGFPVLLNDPPESLIEDLPMMPPAANPLMPVITLGNPGADTNVATEKAVRTAISSIPVSSGTGAVLGFGDLEPPDDLPMMPPGGTPSPLTVLPFFQAAGTQQNIALNYAGSLPFFLSAGTENDIAMNTFSTPQPVGPTNSPTFAGATIDSLAGFLFGTAGAVSAAANATGYRNIIINGGFTINQCVYASAAALATTVYGHDRWKGGAGGGTYSFTQLASPTTITIAANKTLIQVVEDKNVYGGTYVLAWTGTCQARYAINSATPAGAYASSPIIITGQTAGTTMSVEFGNGASSGTLGQVQLELGSVATPFEFRSFQQELEMCQRYYIRVGGVASSGGGGGNSWGSGLCSSATNFYYWWQFPVRMRAGSTAITSSTIGNFIVVSNVSRTASAIAVIQGTVDYALVAVTCATGLTAGFSGLITADTSDWVALSAEL